MWRLFCFDAHAAPAAALPFSWLILVLPASSAAFVPLGHGFLPRQTSQHHQEWVLSLVHAALTEANVKPRDLDAVAYTKGPGMGGPLQTCAVVARTLSQVWNVPIVAVDHCIGREWTQRNDSHSKAQTHQAMLDARTCSFVRSLARPHL